jgi:hypothetical protein
MSNFSGGSRTIMAMAFSLGLLVIFGCGPSRNSAQPTASVAPVTEDASVHPTEGPHHGGLVELGNEEYHAEVVHDEATDSVTMYLLDAAGKSAVPIDASELLVNWSHDGQAEQYTLPASPEPGDPSGKSSRFASADPKLAEALDAEGAEVQLVVTIGGKQYRGEISHDHDH